MTVDRDSFGPYLRGERERRGLTLEAIADSTKIKQSLLAALERNDISRWPTGIFRRGFVREYASAIGLPPEPLVADFTRLFPDDEFVLDLANDIQKAESESSFPHISSLEDDQCVASPLSRLRLAVFDISAVLLISGLIAGMTSVSIWLAFAGVTVSYAMLGTVCLKQSVGTWWLKRSDAWLDRVQQQPPIVAKPIRDLALVASRNQRTADVHRFVAEDQSDNPARKASA